eukprot:GHRQ01004492.1.p1 GENE.GHRQ01004492.1~~GHRQ01004492.1.p1  ORF type:complete len:276 (+),score=89.28 GHRQ01004492.1:313-1140(+)
MSWSDPLQGNPRYESIRTISRGARSFVQLAFDRSTGDHVAIKFTQRGWDDQQMKYLLRELLIHQELSACRHPHIVELRDVFLTPLHLAAVTEYVDGEDLQLFLANTGGRVSEALGRFLFQQLVLALDFVHRCGKVCRGVKLANTLLALAPGQLPLVKLADFCLSKDVGLHGEPRSQVRGLSRGGAAAAAAGGSMACIRGTVSAPLNYHIQQQTPLNCMIYGSNCLRDAARGWVGSARRGGEVLASQLLGEVAGMRVRAHGCCLCRVGLCRGQAAW